MEGERLVESLVGQQMLHCSGEVHQFQTSSLFLALFSLLYLHINPLTPKVCPRMFGGLIASTTR